MGHRIFTSIGMGAVLAVLFFVACRVTEAGLGHAGIAVAGSDGPGSAIPMGLSDPATSFGAVGFGAGFVLSFVRGRSKTTK
jgi:hypothetical protein